MLHNINMLVHIISGTIALIIGIIPFVTRKGGDRHKFYGKIFLAIISITIITALNGILFFRDRPFLMMLTLLVFYQALSSYRAVKYKDAGPGVFDFILVLFMGSMEFTFVWHLEQSNIVWNPALIYYMLGYLNMFLIFDLLRIFKVVKRKKLWVFEHLFKMTGAFSGLFQAAIGTICTFWEPYTQIISASLGTVILLIVIVLYFWKWRHLYAKPTA